MKPRKAMLLLIGVLVLGLTALPAAADAKSKPKKNIYVSLGDSLSVGVQPDKSGKSINTPQGYPTYLGKYSGTKVKALGCGGATTKSIIDGSKACSPKLKTVYKNKSKATSQLTYGLKYIRKHRKRSGS